jgi:hypothetical protein
MMTCPYGQNFDSHRLGDNLVHVPYITVAHAMDGIRRSNLCPLSGFSAGPVSDDVRQFTRTLSNADAKPETTRYINRRQP